MAAGPGGEGASSESAGAPEDSTTEPEVLPTVGEAVVVGEIEWLISCSS